MTQYDWRGGVLDPALLYRPPRKTVHATPIVAPTGYLTLQSAAFQQSEGSRLPFNVLCGDDPPTVIDGYGLWTVIPRPLRLGIPIPQGFNPARMQWNVRFGIWDGSLGTPGWDTSNQAGAVVEDQIDTLDWMAGGGFRGGPSPVVYIDSYRNDGGNFLRTNLIPPQYHGIPWIIDTGITWGTSMRTRLGSRVFQEAAFTTMAYSSALGTHKPPSEKHGLSGGFFKTSKQTDTARKIAASRTGQVPTALVEDLARKICKAPQNNPIHKTRINMERRSINWKIPPNLDVWVPAHNT